ncbi:MAG: ribulose-phosphate 3-epimerase [Elusimicrobiota bacterium]|jgi:ribulose-phosphate 3-epimerase|nr:ribulose-phosphate 3-epimerase [Elusimicrobiota bacterium]
MNKPLIAPSILSANFADLASDIKRVEIAGAEWLHIDVMDGHFVPNLTIGPDVVRDIRKVTNLFLDVHLMISRPEKYWLNFKNAGADLITFHREIEYDPKALISQISASKTKVGISIKPNTAVDEIADLIDMLDLVLIMSVEPGFGGQKFMPEALKKIEILRKLIDEKSAKCLIEVDGGINAQTGALCVKAGADILVSGSFIFSGDAKTAIDSLKGVK